MVDGYVPGVVRETEVALDNVLQQTDGKGIDQLVHHVAQDGSNCIESLVGLTDVRESHVI